LKEKHYGKWQKKHYNLQKTYFIDNAQIKNNQNSGRFVQMVGISVQYYQKNSCFFVKK